MPFQIRRQGCTKNGRLDRCSFLFSFQVPLYLVYRLSFRLIVLVFKHRFATTRLNVVQSKIIKRNLNLTYFYQLMSDNFESS